MGFEKKINLDNFFKAGTGGGTSGRAMAFCLGRPGSNPGDGIKFFFSLELLSIYSHSKHRQFFPLKFVWGMLGIEPLCCADPKTDELSLTYQRSAGPPLTKTSLCHFLIASYQQVAICANVESHPLSYVPLSRVWTLGDSSEQDQILS